MTTIHSSAVLKELHQINARIAALAVEMIGVRTTLDVQFKRIATLQAELDVLPSVRRRREAMRRSASPPPRAYNGNGRSHP